MHFSCICLFVLHVLVLVLLLFLLVSGLAAVCDYDTPLTFLLTFYPDSHSYSAGIHTSRLY